MSLIIIAVIIAVTILHIKIIKCRGEHHLSYMGTHVYTLCFPFRDYTGRKKSHYRSFGEWSNCRCEQWPTILESSLFHDMDPLRLEFYNEMCEEHWDTCTCKYYSTVIDSF